MSNVELILLLFFGIVVLGAAAALRQGGVLLVLAGNKVLQLRRQAPTPGSSSRVFVSYARADQPTVRRLVEALEAEGFEVWWDADVPPGEGWRDTIEAALDGAGCVIGCFSAQARGSEWVRLECTRGHRRGVLVPVALDEAPLPFGFEEVQALSLAAWAGEPSDARFRRLVAAVRAKLGESGPSEGTPGEG